ncbi:MAG: M43 family zinc metalloprotease [Flavobacteriales bacterium]|nr:M43 family zinc metalloprotease [Flavobacteriales bacterium]
MKKLLLVILFYPLLNLYAQNVHRCGTDYLVQKALQSNPDVRKNMEELEAFTQQWIAEHAHDKSEKALLITIPVVVHIVYNNASENLSDARIQSQIDVLNQDFRRLNADASNTPSAFQSVAADVEIEFCLANIDPNGQPTTGITRTSTSVTSFDMNTDNIKFTSQGGKDAWPSNKYLNIWVGDISGGILGYATPPGTFPANQDGVVINYKYFGTSAYGAQAPYNKGRTATHEVGHWLNLKHIWGDDGTSCSGTDNVSDTPNQGGENYGCPSYPLTDACSPSAPGVMFMNYMDYVDDACMNLFTAGQKARMHAAINGPRSSLFNSNGCSGSGGGGGGGGGSGTCDTLSNWTAGDTEVLYTTNGGGFVGGHNEFNDKAKAERFSNIGTNKQVTKIFFKFGHASGYNSSSTVAAALWNETAGAPGSELVSINMPVSAIANHVSNGQFSLLNLTSPVSVGNNFYAGIKLTYSGSLKVALYTSTDGNQVPSTAWEQFSDNTWKRFDDSQSWQLDVSLAVFPVVCDATLGTESIVGINEAKLYPNPTDGQLNLVLPQTNTYEILIYDMMGRLVFSKSIVNEGEFAHLLDLSEHKNGLYFVEIRQGNISTTKKVILNR